MMIRSESDDESESESENSQGELFSTTVFGPTQHMLILEIQLITHGVILMILQKLLLLLIFLKISESQIS